MNIKLDKRFIIYFIIFILVCLIFVLQISNVINSKAEKVYNIKAQNGVLDLSSWDFDDHPILSLDGEWEFAYNQLLPPGSSGASDYGYINVPGLWNSFEYNGNLIGPNAYGTYRLEVLLPESAPKFLALKISDMSGSYKLFVNGEEISSSGIVGKSHSEEMPMWKPIVRTLVTESKQLDIVVHVSNFHHMKGGMWEPILLGSEESVYKNREINLMVSFVLVGILLISALYYLVIYSVMQKNKASLYLAIFCLSAAMREFLIREAVAFLVFPNFPFALFSRLEYMTVPSGPLLLALSLYGLYPAVFSKKALQIVITPFLLYMLIIIFTPLNFFGHLMNPCLLLFIIAFIYLFTVIIAASRKKMPGARLLLFGTFIMLLTAAIDMGYSSKLHNDYNMAYTFSIGFIIFILCQMHSLSLIVSEAFDRSQKLSEAELAFLQAQIVPHFLYNTLNTIIYLTRESPEKARNLLLEFSSYLRGKFDFKIYNQNLFVTFEHELEIVKSYLSIEKVRLNERLEVLYNIDGQTLNCNIMPFILQPLVENAVRHGLKNKTGDCKIVISSFHHKDYIIISIEDNGVGIPKEKILSIVSGNPAVMGTGLYNVNRRMKEVYGEGLEIISTINEGTIINIKIPSGRSKGNA